ncbi:MAG TPA: hypothetical protein DIT63_02395, partial [Gammaproteobacteria bacterium]|nr:hypothetical protein [Gammaproteobacteria bacterium]
ETAYRRLGTATALQRDLHLATVRQLWPDDAQAPRDRGGFETLAARLGADLPAAGERLAHTVTETLTAWQALTRQLDQVTTLTLLDVAGDLRDQLQRLIHPGFVADTPPHWMGELPRYLSAATRRLGAARHDAAADRRRALGLRPLWERYWEHRPVQTTHPHHADWVHLRWLLEELRVALFAPELGTREPVSVARLHKQLDALTGALPARRGAAG